MPSWSPKKLRQELFQWIFALGIFGGGVSHYAAIPLIVALSPGHSDTTRFCPWSPIVTQNHLDHAKKIQNLLRRLAPLTFLIHVQAFRDPLRGELPHVRIFMNDGPNPLTWDAQVLNYCFIRNPSKISSWIWSIISGVVTVLGRPGLGASQAENSPCLNWATQFLTVAYDVACSPNLFIRMAWISYGAVPFRKKNLMTTRVSMLLKSRASPDMLPFSLCNKKRLAVRHKNRPPFPTTLSIPSYDIGM